MGDGMMESAAARPTGLLRDAVRILDAPLRRAHGVFEFSASDDCLLRIAVERARCAIRYGDGVVIGPGERVVTLHFWNEHLPVMTGDGPTMAWANRFRRQLDQSLRELAQAMRKDARLVGIKGVRAYLASATPGHRQTVKRFGAHFRLEPLDTQGRRPFRRRLGGFVDNLWAWMLAWAFNPPALRGRDITKTREEIGMSTATLIAAFPPGPPPREPIILAGSACVSAPITARPRRAQRPATAPARWEPASP